MDGTSLKTDANMDANMDVSVQFIKLLHPIVTKLVPQCQTCQKFYIFEKTYAKLQK
jgi:hypothetical protein